MDILQRLRELVSEALESCGQEPIGSIGSDDHLPGFLDSVVLSSLLVLIEDEWDIEIADDEIGPENFATLQTITGLVEGKLPR